MTPPISQEEPATPPAADGAPIISPILTLAGETFARDLPELLKQHRDKWVAYHGARRLGIVKTCTDAERLVLSERIDPYEIAIWCVEDQPNIDFVGEWIELHASR
jgi:hypothetical protein